MIYNIGDIVTYKNTSSMVVKPNYDGGRIDIYIPKFKNTKTVHVMDLRETMRAIYNTEEYAELIEKSKLHRSKNNAGFKSACGWTDKN